MAVALMRVNPTRMELKRLKARLKTAIRGHKLLKDKTDEMVRKFIVYARENKRLREETESKLNSALKNFMLARASESPQVLD
ncbi:MAG: V-type ATP synthase subunit D, partial [Clostridia bacterium]